MITETNKSKNTQGTYRANRNVSLMAEIIQIKSRIMIYVDVSVKIKKNILCVKKIILKKC